MDRVEVAYAAMVALFAYYFGLRHLQTPQWVYASFQHLVTGTAMTPMQYRTLIPWIVRGIRALNLPGVRTWSLESYRLGVDVASVIAGLYSARWLARRVGVGPWQALCGSWLVALVLPFHYLMPPVTRHYPSDLPAIVFFAVGLALLLQKQWSLFYPLFIVATFNRETTCFLTLAYLFASLGRERLTTIAKHVGAQALLWATVKLILVDIYGANTVRAYSLHFDLFRDRIADNVSYLHEPQAVPLFAIASMFAFLWIPVFALRRYIQHPFIARAIWIIPVYVGSMFYVGELPELRIYGELIPLVTTATLLVATNIQKSPGTTIDAVSPSVQYNHLSTT
jgi:hypothetical protein